MALYIFNSTCHLSSSATATAGTAAMVQDRAAGVVKQAILAVNVVVRTGLSMLGAQVGSSTRFAVTAGLKNLFTPFTCV